MWKTVQILIRCLCQKLTDLNLHYFKERIYVGSAAFHHCQRTHLGVTSIQRVKTGKHEWGGCICTNVKHNDKALSLKYLLNSLHAG